MRFVDPQPAPSAAADPYDLSAPLGPGTTIGLFANGFPDSVNFLTKIEGALAERLDNASFLHMNKGNASRLATEDEVSAITEQCDAVIAAYGH